MRVHTLQHVPFEGLGHIEQWLMQKQYNVSTTRFYIDATLPSLDSFDALIIMGGSMSIYDDGDYPWLSAERQFIKNTIEDGKPVLGICLGSQFIADALGVAVFANNEKEIGWFELTKYSDASKTVFGQHLPENFTALHWHGDTYGLPKNCIRLLSSEACLNQAFSYDNRVLALQFHLEMTASSTRNIINACGHELTPQKFIQDAVTINKQQEHYESAHALLEKLLVQMFSN
ncbi:type 1 glutamine amidotransferase [bacterium AH-315-E07]|nr:type 1 glutamine amidotransferase [bacterium AH-315-E07]